MRAIMVGTTTAPVTRSRSIIAQADSGENCGRTMSLAPACAVVWNCMSPPPGGNGRQLSNTARQARPARIFDALGQSGRAARGDDAGHFVGTDAPVPDARQGGPLREFRDGRQALRIPLDAEQLRHPRQSPAKIAVQAHRVEPAVGAYHRAGGIDLLRNRIDLRPPEAGGKESRNDPSLFASEAK